MGRADYYDHGNHNKICDYCGQKWKSSELRETWDHYWACPYDFELRQPQDRLKSRKDKQTVPDARPEAVSNARFWDGTEIEDGKNFPSVDEFLQTNEVKAEDL